MRPWYLPAVLASLAVATGIAVVVQRTGSASAQPPPPTRFHGALTIDGAPAPIGTFVTAVINGRDCGSKATDQIGRYSVDAAHAAQVPGCAQEGDYVLFRVGARFAAQFDQYSAGVFKPLDLMVSGAGLAPALPSATVTATATVSPTPTPSPTPPPPFTQSSLNLTGDLCIPLPDQGGCDQARAALWRGDTAAWAAAEAAEGRPEPDSLDVALLRHRLRLEAGDPEARARAARFERSPLVVIASIRYRGAEEFEGDEYIEIANLGGAAREMTGWRIRAVESGVDMLFTEGTTLEPGARCRFYTGAAREDSCPGSFELSGGGIWPDDTGNAELWNDTTEQLVDATRYHTDPAAQPPAPTLQGVR